jgi:hypothetical protein
MGWVLGCSHGFEGFLDPGFTIQMMAWLAWNGVFFLI